MSTSPHPKSRFPCIFLILGQFSVVLGCLHNQHMATSGQGQEEHTFTNRKIKDLDSKREVQVSDRKKAT